MKTRPNCPRKVREMQWTVCYAICDLDSCRRTGRPPTSSQPLFTCADFGAVLLEANLLLWNRRSSGDVLSWLSVNLPKQNCSQKVHNWEKIWCGQVWGSTWGPCGPKTFRKKFNRQIGFNNFKLGLNRVFEVMAPLMIYKWETTFVCFFNDIRGCYLGFA